MEKYEKQTKLYLIFTILMGSLMGYLDSGKFDVIYLTVFGAGIACLSIVVGIFLEAAIDTVFKNKNVEKDMILDQDLRTESRLKLEEAKAKILTYRNRFKYGFLFSLSIVLYEIFRTLS